MFETVVGDALNDSHHETLSTCKEELSGAVDRLKNAVSLHVRNMKTQKQKELEARMYYIIISLFIADVRHTGALLVSIRDAKDLATLKDDGSIPETMCTIEIDNKVEGRTTVKCDKAPLFVEDFLIEKYVIVVTVVTVQAKL